MKDSCIVCGKEFECYKSTKGKKKYCSDECKKMISHITVKCIFCGNEYIIAKSRYNEKYIKFKCCSNDCYKKYKIDLDSNKYQKNIYTCSNCKKGFYGKRYNKTNLKFCSQECSKIFMKDKNSPFYKNGYTINVSGYKCIKVGDKYLYEHRIIMEEYIGRKLKEHEVIHHKDENKLNNCIENLQLMTKKEHDKLHALRSKNAKSTS